MRFTIIWSKDAIRDLTDIWLRSGDRNRITRAAADIDRVLATDPQYVGESRAGTERVEFVDPLGFRFEVVVDDARVTVGAVWLVRQV